MKGSLLLLLLLSTVYSQTSTCTNTPGSTSTNLTGIASGIVTLGAPLSQIAQTTFTQSLAGFNLDFYSDVFAAVAFAGFTGAANQQYYSLVVDRVSFNNGNTVMVITMSYSNPSNSLNTTWSRVRLSWIAVSTAFQTTGPNGLGSYIWAGMTGLTAPFSGTPGAIFSTSVFGIQTAGMTGDSQCGYINTSPPNFDILCAGFAGARFITHAYISGFRFNPNGPSLLGASVLMRDGLNTAASMNQALNQIAADIVTRGVATTDALTGPIVTIDPLNNQLEYIKISVVMTIILDAANYPNSNPTTFLYSGVYMNSTLFNQPVPIVKGGSGINQNFNYFPIYSSQYNIFGLSAFKIGKMPASQTIINYDVDLPSTNILLLKTDNINYLNSVRVSADLWNGLVTTSTCSNSNTPTPMTSVLQQQATSVPAIDSSAQFVSQPLSGLTYSYTVLPPSGNNTSNSVTFTNNIYMAGFTPFGANNIIFTLTGAATGGNFPASVPVQYSLALQGNIVVSNNITFTNIAPLTPTADNSLTIPIGYIFTSSNPVITISITIPRDTTVGTVITSQLDIKQYLYAYNPSSNCCVQFCPPNSGVTFGTSTIPTCNKCQAGSFYNSVTSQCQCNTGFYNVTQPTSGLLQCFACLAPLCGTCTQATPTVCSTCVTGATFVGGNTCTCNSGFYQTGNNCTVCPVRCATCTLNGVCLTCADTNTRDTNNQCQCKPGFFQSNAASCLACSSTCATCTSATSCSTCNDPFATAINGQCVCNRGYFRNIQSNVCQKCDASCSACNLLPNLCSTCDAAANRVQALDQNGNQICVCASGFIQNAAGNCVQASCSADPNCATCIQVLGTFQCISCVPNANLYLALPQQQCLCLEGYFNLNGVCTSCGTGCATCTSATTCTSCVPLATPNGNGTCTCPSATIFVTSPVRFCQSCPTNALTCTSATVATSCQTNFTLVNGACLCQQGRFINSNSQCVPCITGCLACNNSQCLSCNQGLYLQTQVCVARCSSGFYQSGAACLPCLSGCVLCTQASICTFCANGLFIVNGQCVTNCPNGTVADNVAFTCTPCNSPCATCVQHPSNCLTCLNFRYMFNGNCVTTCPSGTYANPNGVCSFCDITCAACVGTPTTCSVCPTGQVIYQGKCYNTCPYIMVNGVCTFGCANGQFVTGTTCSTCSPSCATCSGIATNCTSCSSGTFASNGQCVTTCPANTLGQSGTCLPCASQCNGCSGSTTSCTGCANGFFLSGAICVQSCPSGTFSLNGVCQVCGAGCRVCTSLTQCSQCTNPSINPTNGVCGNCSFPCATCSSTSVTSCTSCVSGYGLTGTTCTSNCPAGSFIQNGLCVCNSGVFFNGQCIAACPSGFSSSNGQCIACSSNCQSCTPTACTVCNSGFLLNQVTGVCQPSSGCQFGQYPSNGGCQRICPTGMYFYESVCLTACLQGYQDNGVGGCIPYQASSGCSFPFFLANGVCISNCPTSTFPDSTTRVCKSCSSNCYSCLGGTFCTGCNSGYNLINGVCVSASFTCPSGQFSYNNVCYAQCPIGTFSQGNFCQRNCPSGTFFFNNNCYRRCPTPLSTLDACVSLCPPLTTQVNNLCQPSSRTCAQGQYFDAVSGICQSCQYPCSECLYTATFCTSCQFGLTLNLNLCLSNNNNCGSGNYLAQNNQCQPCPSKCATCLSANICSACASGFNFNGFDCVAATTVLQKVTLTLQAIYRQGNVGYAVVCPNIIPNGLTLTQRSNFFSVVPSASDISNLAFANQWFTASTPACVVVSITFNNFPTSSNVFLVLNSQQLGSSYNSIGYSVDSTSFISVPFSQNLSPPPTSVSTPTSSFNTVAITPSSSLSITQVNSLINSGARLN